MMGATSTRFAGLSRYPEISDAFSVALASFSLPRGRRLVASFLTEPSPALADPFCDTPRIRSIHGHTAANLRGRFKLPCFSERNDAAKF